MTASQRTGLALGYDPGVDVRGLAESAARAEAHGFDMGFFSETLFTNRDSASAIAAMALRTRAIGLGTTQVVKLRSSLVMAQTAATLDELSGGRLTLVVGAYTAKHADRNGVPLTDPLTTLNEYIHCIRRLLAGETVDFDGEVVSMRGARLSFTPVRAEIPIWLAAASRKGLLNAGGIADGVLLDAGTSPEYAANAIALLREGSERAGRDPGRLKVAQLINTSIEDDASRAVDAIRWEIASKFTFRSTPRAKLTVGEPTIDRADLPRFEAALAEGGKDALARALPESYVRGLSATGTVADVRDRVQRYRDAGVHLPLVRPAAPHQLDALLRAFS
jgi:5,10-methylenetetrahydromethanopterin reductase